MSFILPSQHFTKAPQQRTLPKICRDTGAKRVFSFCLLFIVCVSIYDTYLVAVYRDSILVNERNPICKFLIQQDLSQLTWFMTGKLLGNIAVVTTLSGLFFFGFRHALIVAKAVACFQLMLLIYLQFSDPTTGVLDFDGLLSPCPAEFNGAVLSAVAHLGVVVPTLLGGVLAKRKWDATRLGTIR